MTASGDTGPVGMRREVGTKRGGAKSKVAMTPLPDGSAMLKPHNPQSTRTRLSQNSFSSSASMPPRVRESPDRGPRGS